MNKNEFIHIIIGGRDVLVPSAQVKEVVRPPHLTTVPMGPEHLLGLANIHGQIVCVIDVGKCTSLPASSKESGSRARILILRDPVKHVGIWAEEVRKLLRVSTSDVADAKAQGIDIVPLNINGYEYELLDCSNLLQTNAA